MLSLLAAAALAVPSSAAGVPDSVKAELTRVESSAKRSAIFRALLAENDGIERRMEALPSPEFLVFARDPRRLAYDAARLKLRCSTAARRRRSRSAVRSAQPGQWSGSGACRGGGSARSRTPAAEVDMELLPPRLLPRARPAVGVLQRIRAPRRRVVAVPGA